MQKAFRAIVSGRVQMVMYRDFAQRHGRSLSLVGEVKNLSDGTVEVVAEGDAEKLNHYIEKLKRGSMLARVDNVEVIWQEPSKMFTDFDIVYH